MRMRKRRRKRRGCRCKRGAEDGGGGNLTGKPRKEKERNPAAFDPPPSYTG